MIRLFVSFFVLSALASVTALAQTPAQATPQQAPAQAQAQPVSGEVFEDPDGVYVVTLPAGWLAIVNTNALGQHDVNIVYRVRENGALKVRKIDLDADVDPLAYATKDESERLRFNPGYDKLALEKFLLSAGKYGAVAAYDYKNNAGQPFTSRVYYVRKDEKTLFVLQFTGRKNTLGVLRSQTDSIARSFRAK